jgi:predicted RNA-binding Zn-ribbon protein involved in translation (DUF1610 family)
MSDRAIPKHEERATMLTTVCIGCRRLVERSAMHCPHCGALTRWRATPVTLMATFIFGLSMAIAIVASVLAGIYFSTE